MWHWDIRVPWLVYVRMYCVPFATLNQKRWTRLLYLGDDQIITLFWKPWSLILCNGLSVVWMDFLFIYTRRSMGLGKISLVHWNHSKLFSSPSPFLRGTVNGDLKTFQKYWKFPYGSLRTDSQVERAEKENRLALFATHYFPGGEKRLGAWRLCFDAIHDHLPTCNIIIL